MTRGEKIEHLAKAVMTLSELGDNKTAYVLNEIRLEMKSQLELPDGLEEAAEEHAGLNFDRQMEYKSFWNDVDTFKAGAEWGAEHTKQKPELVQHPAISYMYNADAGRGEQIKQAILALLKSDLIQVAGRGFTKTELIEWVETRPAEVKEDK